METGFLISASILSADFAQLGEQIRQVETGDGDWIHFDVMDGHYVPNLSLGPQIVASCRKITDLPFDVHLMVQDPDPLLDSFAKAGADSITVHIEASTHIYRTLQRIQQLGLQSGIAINPGTPIHAIDEILPLVDLVLVMTVNPGFAGQAFLDGMYSKIVRMRERLDQIQSPAILQVDGGITSENIKRLAECGAQAFVAASAIFQHPDGIMAGIRALKAALEPARA